MTSTPDRHPLDGCDDPTSVLDFARARKVDEEQADREVMIASAKFAAMHSGDSVVGPLESWHEQSLPLGGEGCPEVTEYAVVEYSAAMGLSPASGRRRLSLTVESHHRLTRCWARMVSRRLSAWRLRMVAERTLCLSPAAASFVDQHVAPVAHSIGPAQLERLVAEAVARFDPEQAERDRAAAAEARHFTVDLAQVGHDGTVHVEGGLDFADAYDLDGAVSAGAAARAALGSTETLDVRRSQALGDMARAQLALGFEASDVDASPPTAQVRCAPKRSLVLHAHIAADAIRGFTAEAPTGNDLVRLQECAQALSAEQIRQWCGNGDVAVTVRPVIDLDQHIHVMSYEASDRLKEQTRLRDIHCVHPWCTRPAIACDCEHRVPHDPADPTAGPTCTCNQAPTCRPHHRAKTTGGWSYVTIEPGTYLWRSPLGYQYLRDHSGTIDVTPDDDRRRYARRLIAHFGDQPSEP